MEQAEKKKKTRVLVLWNQVDEDIYERWQVEGPRPLEWKPEEKASEVGTVTEELDALLKAISDAGYDATLVNVEDDLQRLLAAIELHRPDVIFNLIEFFNEDSTEEGYVAGLFDMLCVPYTGCGPRCLTTCQDKYRTKILLDAADLPTAPFFLVTRRGKVPSDHGIQFPLIVKPSREDASGGIELSSVVRDQAALEAKIEAVFKEYNNEPVLVEQYIEGREIHAAVIGNENATVLPLFEMEFDDSEFNKTDEWRPQIISYSAKWDPNTKDFYSMDAKVPPEDLDPEMEAHIRDIAIGAYRALECRDYARVDMRVDDEGDAYILEINPNPDLVEETAFMLCAQYSGRTFSETVAEVIEMALARGRKLYGEDTEVEAPKTVEYMPSEEARKKAALLAAGLPPGEPASESVAESTGGTNGALAVSSDPEPASGEPDVPPSQEPEPTSADMPVGEPPSEIDDVPTSKVEKP